MNAPPALEVPEHVKALLNDQPEHCDDKMDYLLRLLSEQGAAQCWHKHGTFKQHLFGVWRILHVWKQPISICRCGLFHSAYSNSYVNLSTFKPMYDRKKLEEAIGTEAEDLVLMFCTIPRQHVVFDLLLPLWSEHPDQIRIPSEGFEVKHIQDPNIEIHLTPNILKAILILTMSDFAEQFYDWQDKLFHNTDASFAFEKRGNVQHSSGALFPGTGKPGLWMSCLSKMGQLARACEKSEQEYQKKEIPSTSGLTRPFIVMPLPPVFAEGVQLLQKENEVRARDLYWDVVTNKTEPEKNAEAKADLLQVVEWNPHVGEPRAVLAQILNSEGLHEEAIKQSQEALRLLCAWGTSWDKRISWEGWVSWTRVQHQCAVEKAWPKTAWGVISLGLVKS